jgi:hypothetical protein
MVACMSASAGPRWVMNTRPRLAAQPSCSIEPDRDAVAAEHAGHQGQHAGPVEHVEVEVVRALDLVDGPQHALPSVPMLPWLPLCRLTAASTRSPSTALAVGKPPAPRP